MRRKNTTDAGGSVSISIRTQVLAIGALLVSASAAVAQRIMSIQCRIDPSHVYSCSSDEECSRVYRDHLCTVHGMSQYCNGGSAERPPDPKKMIILGPMVGALGGLAIGGASDVGKTDEQKQADQKAGKLSGAAQGAIIGAGVGLAGGLFIAAVAKYDVPIPGRSWIRKATVISERNGRLLNLGAGFRW